MKRMISIIILLTSITLTACSYNPLVRNHQLTGHPAGAVVGAAVGAGGAMALGASKPFVALTGLTGGALGYYMTTLRSDAAEIIHAGGTAYEMGQLLGIYIPSDHLFAQNTADFLPGADAILNSARQSLARYPANNILISGSTSGFYEGKWAQALSLRRAQKVASYLWDAGVNQGEAFNQINQRKLQYTGYGHYFPIANTQSNEGIRQNNRIQIISYPSDYDLNIDKKHMVLYNIGAFSDDEVDRASDSPSDCGVKEDC